VSILPRAVRLGGEKPATDRRSPEEGGPMGRIVVVENVTLDGGVQAPVRCDEDRRGGFAHGGWAQPYQDEVMARVMAEGMAEATATGGALLFGRRTYEDFAGYWPRQTDNPFTPVLNAQRKYVASRTLRGPLTWENSTLLTGDAAQTVAVLKAEPVDLTVLGSGELVRSLLAADLVDELWLSIHPLVLGTGQRLFAGAGPSRTLRLVDSVPTTTGVMIATYRRIP
jgi:dihydrofolate reductase